MEFKPERLAGVQEAADAGTPFYIAAELGPDWGGREFLLGDGLSYNGFRNAPLVATEDYLAIQGVASSLNGVSLAHCSFAATPTLSIATPAISF